MLRAALLILLAEMTASTDLVIGTPVAGRDDPNLEQVVGTFTTTVAIRTEIAAATTVEDVVKAARASELRAFDHATVPFRDVVTAVAAESSEARHPIFQVALSLDVFTSATLDMGTCTSRSRRSRSTSPSAISTFTSPNGGTTKGRLSRLRSISSIPQHCSTRTP